MKYFIDTEFIEGFHKPWIGKRRHFIDLISIGIVAEDGRTYYAISNEYSYTKADTWVKENVILPLYEETVYGDARNQFDEHNFHCHFGKPNAQIAQEIREFTGCWVDISGNRSNIDSPEFYAYFADYDWVVFCSLFGRMIDLPKGFPMYCRDLKQTLDEKARAKFSNTHFAGWRYDRGNKEPITLELAIKYIKEQSGYPKQANEHNALADAKWNFELYKFLQIL